MPQIPDPLYIFHITALDNIDRIAHNACLLSKNTLKNNQITHLDIAYQEIQGRRAAKQVIVGVGGVLHDYVPFYFAPRSPMLFTINNGNVPGCAYKQEDIVHLVSDVDTVVTAGLDFVFYDKNASVFNSTAYSDIADLDKIDWPLFFEKPTLDGYCKFWKSNANNPRYMSRMETRQAEFLVKDRFILEHIHYIGVIDDSRKNLVEGILQKHGLNIDVYVKKDWYFLGQ